MQYYNLIVWGTNKDAETELRAHLDTPSYSVGLRLHSNGKHPKRTMIMDTWSRNPVEHMPFFGKTMSRTR